MICLSSNLFAQNFDCGTVYQAISIPSYQRSPSPADNVKYVYNIHFTIVRNSDGSIPNYNDPDGSNSTFGEKQAMQALYLLNKNFNSFNVFFKYKGFEFIDDGLLSNSGSMNGVPSTPNAITCIFMNNPGANGVSIQGNTRIAIGTGEMSNLYGAELVICHEMGHAMSLFHVAQNGGTIDCEHVTRNASDSNYNADYAGDAIEDTPAMGNLVPTFNNCNFVPTPNYYDCEGTPLQNIIAANFMDGWNSSP